MDYLITYPDTLVRIWKHMHKEDVSNFSAEICGTAWECIENKLAHCLRNCGIPGICCLEDAQEKARDFLVKVLDSEAPCPEFIYSFSILVRRARKYLAQANSPALYEAREILHTALRTLEKDKRIERDSASKGYRISADTSFALPGIPENHIASWEDYEGNKSTVTNFKTKIWGSTEHTRILSPSNAQDLVLQLLKAFGGWTKEALLFKAMKNHIPEQLEFVKLEPNPGIDNNPLENIAAPEDHWMEDFDKMQIIRLANQTSERIWKQICKISNEVFCCYYLPNTLSNSKRGRNLQDFGKSSTISDQNHKIETIVRNEVAHYIGYDDVYKSDAITRTLNHIFVSLYGRCTKSGYDPGLRQEV